MKIFKREPQAFASTLLPLVILSLGLGLSVAVAWRLHNEISAVATADFERGADRISSEIARRFRQPVYGLNGAKGVYVAS